jgi:thiol-disulfide isomerase/thioredoxin
MAAQQISFDHIDFQSNPAWEKVLTQARQSGKLIFLDGYTTWCGPCRKMEKEVFTMPEVANYFNQKFINVKYDMEHDEGINLRKQYNVNAFPTYLFINSTGQVIHRIIGAYTKSGEFLAYSKLAVTPGKNYAELHQRYRNGERNPEMMFSYLQVLKLAGEKDKEEEIVKSYLSLMTKDHFMDSSYWRAAKLFIHDPFSREFKILIAHRDEVAAVIGDEEVDGKIYEVIDNSIRGIKTSNLVHAGENSEENLLKFLRDAHFPRRNELLARALATFYAHQGNWYDYACTVDAMIDFRLLEGFDGVNEELDAHARKIHRLALDETLLRKALRWSEYVCEHETRPSFLAQFLNTKISLLEKLGMEPEAESAKQIARSIKQEANKTKN